ncbi:hypothetical protein [Cronobacter dublinensis]|uniref:hypothetical protein n=1 Tax=Cronobacter dublinensis TaxID=413497 RepID=UPI00300E529D
MNNDELIAAGHELAKCLDSNTPLIDIAKLLSKMAAQLDVTTAELREKTKQCDAEHNDVLVWEKTMFKVCGEDGVKSVAEKFASLEASRAALAAENAALKSAFNPEVIPEEAVEAFTETVIMDHDWDDTGEWSWVENDTDVIRAVLKAIKPETPATDAFIAEQRAQGVEMFADFCRKKGDVRAYCFFNDAALNAEEFAAELRKGGAA